MDKKNVEVFLYKDNIKIIMSGNWQYNGKLINIGEDSLVFDDQRAGIIAIDLAAIKLIRLNMSREEILLRGEGDDKTKK